MRPTFVTRGQRFFAAFARALLGFPEALRQKLERARGERIHVGDTVAAASLERLRTLDRSAHRDDRKPWRVPVAVALRPRAPALAHTPGGRKVRAHDLRPQERIALAQWY